MFEFTDGHQIDDYYTEIAAECEEAQGDDHGKVWDTEFGALCEKHYCEARQKRLDAYHRDGY